MLYTIGTALNRALSNELTVHILVGGEWLSGQVVAVDGHGVVLNSHEREHSVIRVEAVSAVKIATTAPVRRPIAGPVTVPWPRRSYE